MTDSPSDPPQPDAVSLPLQRRLGGFSRDSVQAAVAMLTHLLAEAQQRTVDAEARVGRFDAERKALRIERDAIADERDALKEELRRFHEIERSLGHTLALAEEAALNRQRQAEREAERIVEEARNGAVDASRVAADDRNRALADVLHIREQLQRALGSIDHAVQAGVDLADGDHHATP